MPFDYDKKVGPPWPVGVAKAEVNGEEVLIKIDKEQMAILAEKMEKIELPAGIDKNIFQATAESFKAFAVAVKPPNIEEEEVPNHWAHVRSAEMLVHYPRTAKQGAEYEDHTVNPGWLNYHNVKDLLARFFVTIHANYGKVPNWRNLCIGITSLEHEGGGQMPMFDYDGKNIKTRVKKDVKQLQKQFGLGDASIYETRRGLHVYFFSDLVANDQYTEMLNSVNCCKGFKNAFERNGYAVLRVSAKYTEFDILPYKVIISPYGGATRPGRKAALIQELLRLGQECGTHFASLYPQWGRYQEDKTPWKVGGKKRPGRRVKKISKDEYQVQQEIIKMKMKKMEVKNKKDMVYKMSFNDAKLTNWSNTVSTTTTDNITYTNTGTYK